MSKTGLHSILNIIIGAVLLSSGGLIYLLFRSRYVLLNRIAYNSSLGQVIDDWRITATNTIVPEWVVYSLPGGLWAISYILIIDSLMRHRNNQYRLLWASPIPISGAISELMQFLNILPGTFDMVDLMFYIIPYIFYSLLIINKQPLSWRKSQ